MKTAMQRHLDAIKAGQVTATNVIGIRMGANHVARLREGWAGNRSNATPAEVEAVFSALAEHEPLVRGDLHASGVRIVYSKRWAKRFGPVETEVIRTLHGFRLVRESGVLPSIRPCSASG